VRAAARATAAEARAAAARATAAEARGKEAGAATARAAAVECLASHHTLLDPFQEPLGTG